VATVPGQKRQGLAFQHPFLEPYELVLLLYRLVLAGEEYAAVLATETLFAALLAPTDNLKTATSPTGFFLT
jgi:hypothetical protein